MVLKHLSNYLFQKSPQWKHLNQKLLELESDMQALKKDNLKEESTIQSPTIIEYLNVEKVIIDKYEQSNNFGALGIKSLEGRLNIGANYGMTSPDEDIKDLFKDKLTHKKKAGSANSEKPTPPSHPPKTTIRPRGNN